MRCPAAAGSIPGQGNEMMMAEVSLDELGPVDCGVIELPAGATSSTIPEAEDETVLAARIAAHGGHRPAPGRLPGHQRPDPAGLTASVAVGDTQCCKLAGITLKRV